VRQARYIEVDLLAPGLEVSAALEKAQEIVNRAGGSDWSYGHRPSDFRMVIYREFQTKKAFREALAAIRQGLGGRKFAREIPAPP